MMWKRQYIYLMFSSQLQAAAIVYIYPGTVVTLEPNIPRVQRPDLSVLMITW